MDTKTSPLVVGRGVDTLVLNVYFRDGQHKPCKRELPHELKEQLDAWKQAAIVEEEPIPVPLSFEGVNPCWRRSRRRWGSRESGSWN